MTHCRCRWCIYIASQTRFISLLSLIIILRSVLSDPLRPNFTHYCCLQNAASPWMGLRMRRWEINVLKKMNYSSPQSSQYILTINTWLNMKIRKKRNSRNDYRPNNRRLSVMWQMKHQYFDKLTLKFKSRMFSQNISLKWLPVWNFWKRHKLMTRKKNCSSICKINYVTTILWLIKPCLININKTR